MNSNQEICENLHYDVIDPFCLEEVFLFLFLLQCSFSLTDIGFANVSSDILKFLT